MLSVSSIAPPPGDQNHEERNENNDRDKKPPASSSSPSDDEESAVTMNISNVNRDEEEAAKQRRRAMFGDCALVEIIHLHDCLRGALHALERDLTDLSRMVLHDPSNNNNNSSSSSSNNNNNKIGPESQQRYHNSLMELESRATARFQVIWSVFRAHSAAEDEFIWPALRLKTEGRIQGCNSPCYQPCGEPPSESSDGTFVGCCGGAKQFCNQGKRSVTDEDEVIEQEEYEEDHADEERMFTMMDHLLARLRKGLIQQKNTFQRQQQRERECGSNGNPPKTNNVTSYNSRDTVTNTMKEIQSLVKTLNQHLMVHLEKEEKQCMPLVLKHLSKSEIHDLVGKIMGKRSSDMIAQILTMAVQNLNETDKEEMVKHMKQAMVGTFFDRWLQASGWMDGIQGNKKRAVSPPSIQKALNNKRQKSNDVSSSMEANLPTEGITSQAELEKLIRAVATNPSLDPVQKNATIQGLRTSVWKRNQRLIMTTLASPNSCNDPPTPSRPSQTLLPSAYYQQTSEGQTALVWKESSSNNHIDTEFVPKFSASELAPTYHDQSNDGKVLGCAHYARACKLRHPLSGRLYTCRLCCEHEREAPSGDKDEPLDRYAVTEISCMECNSLQPAAKTCANQECKLHKKGFAEYYCDICHLYDDRPRPIFHCPYCNTCRSGHGLGIDYRHCMRCNACVAIADKDHRCIPQKLQGACPICHDTLFNSTEPLRGLRCGHVMHLSCFTEYRRGQRYTCPLCMRCMEDMSEYFALMDQAVRMQIMPPMYQNMFCNIYCQDCDKTGQCRYHFVGQKCPHCGSYNTREMGRFEGAPPSHLGPIS
ncbi:zinc-ribbon domain containing protein [Nitzschia inconspicua]|uniref:Zinc-ribbon domain containing protein n=1 Tax=Nitzschia inconspicua TaxID=303405 RepID=A0A9K3LRJ2_9STRA|nr:zinc-ribbon domain containing protein [Nitzschia inconspicua]